MVVPTTPAKPGTAPDGTGVVIDCNIAELYYGKFKAVRDTNIPIQRNSITAFIGPSAAAKAPSAFASTA